MSFRSLNGITTGSQQTSVVITNRMEATLPLEQTQADFTAPILIGLKGLNGFGGAGKVIKVDSSNNGLIWADDDASNWTYQNPNLSPLQFQANVLVVTSTNSTNPSTSALYKFLVKGTSLFDGFTIVYDDTTATNNRLQVGTDTAPSGSTYNHGMLYTKCLSGFTATGLRMDSQGAGNDVRMLFVGPDSTL